MPRTNTHKFQMHQHSQFILVPYWICVFELTLCRVFVCDYICFSFSRYFILLVLDLELNVGGFRVRIRSNNSKLKKYRRQMCEYRVSNFVGKKVHTIEKTTYGFLALCFAFFISFGSPWCSCNYILNRHRYYTRWLVSKNERKKLQYSPPSTNPHS